MVEYVKMVLPDIKKFCLETKSNKVFFEEEQIWWQPICPCGKKKIDQKKIAIHRTGQKIHNVLTNFKKWL